MININKKFWFLLIIYTLLFFGKTVYSNDASAGKAGAFLRVGVGARPLGMGGAFTAISNDVYGSYWNPAGLVQLQTLEIGSMYGIMSLDRKYGYLGFAFPVSRFLSLGMNAINLRIDDIERRDSQENLLGRFSDAEYAFNLSMGILVIENLYVGGNFKFLYHELADNIAKGLGYDLGVLVIPRKFLSIGLVFQDIGSSLKWNTDSNHKDRLPLNIRLGNTIKLLNEQLILSMDLVSTDIGDKSRSTELHAGFDFWPTNYFATRAGFDNSKLTGGISLGVSQFQVDYSIAKDNIDGSFVHLLSLLIKHKKDEI